MMATYARNYRGGKREWFVVEFTKTGKKSLFFT
jgi:hypothetical protein